MEALRPQVLTTLCEVLHNCRKGLSLPQLGRVVRLLTALVMDRVRLGFFVGFGAFFCRVWRVVL